MNESESKPWFLYMIECQDNSIYTGITLDVAARYAAHVSGKGARYTRSHPPKKLIAVIEFPNRSLAAQAEYDLKQLTPDNKRKFAANQFPAVVD
jgi:putative endonuclease